MTAPADLKDEGVARCRVCGCTEDRACEGGCYWVPDFDPPYGDRPATAGPLDGLCSTCSGDGLLDLIIDMFGPTATITTVTVRDGLL